MFFLDATTKTIDAATAAAVVSDLQCEVVWNDVAFNGANVNIGPGTQRTLINNTPATIVPAIVTNQRRDIRYISLYNPNNETHTISIRLQNTVGPVNSTIHRVQLKSKYRAEYNYEDGWKLYDDKGSLIEGNQFVTYYFNAQSAPGAVLTDLFTATANTTIISFFAANRANTSKTFRVSLAPLGAADANSQYLYYDYSIPRNDTLIISVPIKLINTDKIRVYGQDANVTFTVTGEYYS